MLSSTSVKQYDGKKFPLCAPWDGKRGRSFKDEFMPDFTSSLGLKSDDYANQQEHLHGNVPGGVPVTTAAQLLANNLHVNAELSHDGQAHEQRKSKTQFKNRDAALIANLYNHIPSQPVRDRINEIKGWSAAAEYEKGAPLLTVVIAANIANVANGTLVYPADHPNTGQPISLLDRRNYQKCGNSLARHIIRIIGGEASPDPNAGVQQMLTGERWAGIKMSHVPIDAATPSNLATLIRKVGGEHKQAEDQLRIKFLSVLTSPPEIATKAVAELQRCSAHLQKANGEPDFEKLVTEIQDLWDLSVTRGTLKLSAKTVEAFNLESLECESCDGEVDPHLYYVRSGQNESRSTLGLQHEPQCWGCHGFGHNKADCPSPRVFRSLHEAAKISALRAGAQQSRTGAQQSRTGTGGVAARGRGRGGSSGRGSSSARGSQRQPPGHGNVNSLDEEYEEHEQPVYSATGEPIGTMKTSEQFEEPMSKRFPLGKYGEEDLGATAFELDINGLNVMALQTLNSESDDAEREPAELPSESSALSADYVMPPLLDGYGSEGDYYESDDEGDDYGNGDHDYSNGYSLFPPCKPKSASTCNDEKQIPESSNKKEIPEKSKSFLVKVLRTFSGKLHEWSQPPQMLEPFSIGLPSGGAPPSPPASPPADHECNQVSC